MLCKVSSLGSGSPPCLTSLKHIYVVSASELWFQKLDLTPVLQLKELCKVIKLSIPESHLFEEASSHHHEVSITKYQYILAHTFR